MSRLPDAWVSRIFQSLTGIYGAQFRSKFSQLENGVDVGIAMAAQSWAKELGNFADKPEAISYALDHLPTDHAPNALEFRDICRRAPQKQVQQVEYKPTAEDRERQREMSHKATQAVARKDFDGLLWAKKPKSQRAMDFVSDAKKHAGRFPALAAVYDFLLENKICNEAGKLLHRWDGQNWVKN